MFVVEGRYDASRRQEIQAGRRCRAQMNTAKQWLERCKQTYVDYLNNRYASDPYLRAERAKCIQQKELDGKRKLNDELWKFAKLAREEQQAYLARHSAEMLQMQQDIYLQSLKENQ